MFTLQEALSAIADKKEFSVNEKTAGITVIDYNVQLDTTFRGRTEREELILKNLRGTAFETASGKIISLPLHKFHNLNECPGYLDSDIDFTKPHTVMLKLDGSMIRPIPVGFSYRLGTRAGVTDVSMLAEDFIVSDVKRYVNYDRFIRHCIDMNATPVFEFTSRMNKVVVDYPEPELTLLAIRENETGEYYTHRLLESITVRFDIPLVSVFDSQSLKLSDVRAWDKDEGVVIAFSDGFRVKVKADAYVTKHRAKDLVRFEKDVVRLILEDKLDDVLPIVDEDVRTALKKYQTEMLDAVQKYRAHLSLFLLANVARFDEPDFVIPTRAEFAAMVKGDFNAKFYFRMFDGKDPGLKDFILSACGSGPKLDEVLTKMELPRWRF